MLQRSYFYLFLLFLSCDYKSWAVMIDDIYPSIGPEGTVQTLDQQFDDASSPEIQLKVPIVFYGKKYYSVFVNSNGLLSFQTEIPNFSNVKFPLRFPVIALLYTDIDTRGSGQVYYRETSEQNLLSKIKKDIHNNFPDHKDFEPMSIFITTWDSVGYFDKRIDKVNNFQVAIASNGTDSFAVFYYLSNGIQWIQSDGKIPNYPDAKAQAGFTSDTGEFYSLPGSGTDQVVNLELLSNVDMPGTWMFYLGNSDSPQVMAPNRTPSAKLLSRQQTELSCASHGLAHCHSSARCVDYTEGFCCECNSGFYGNGQNCLKNGVKLRVIGKLNGQLNGVRFKDLDLHAFVVPAKGRSYSAISQVPVSVGQDLQSLLTIGNSIAWMFAIADAGAKNGYQLTGGVMNRSVEIEFPQTGNHVSIKQYFKGLDAFGHLEVQTDIVGTVPAISEGSKITMQDFDDQYTKVSPGLLKSHSRHSYQVRDTRLETSFVIDETIQYKECAYQPKDDRFSNFRMRTARNYLVFDSSEAIVRFAMTNRITPLGSANPCRNAQCGPNSKCVADRTSYKCVCDVGFDRILSPESNTVNIQCSDVNECQTGRDNCHVNAECINDIGSFRCLCKPGFAGNGVQCTKQITCNDLNCNIDATCRSGADGQPVCYCNPGYSGDGYVCQKEDAFVDCRRVNYCSENADCVYINERSRAECKCQAGFEGDGRQCQRRTCDEMQCGVNATCLVRQDLMPECVCNSGFTGDGYVCQRQQGHIDCRQTNNCHVNAACVYNQERQWAECRCNPGYRGDGIRCQEVTCDEMQCGANATCRVRQNSLPQCVCNTGFTGDGYVCQQQQGHIDCRQTNNCHENAACVYIQERQWAECRCNPGFRGDGIRCQVVTCDELQCGQNATCRLRQDQLAECVCNSGFVGNGYTCQKDERHADCRSVNNCDLNADCVFNEELQRAECQCKAGFQGNGEQCQRDITCDDLNCHANATCRTRLDGLPECFCNYGFTGDGYVCTPEKKTLTCNDLMCHEFSSCRLTEQNAPQCFCNDGYTGDGYVCNQQDIGCNVLNRCHAHATCVFNENDKSYNCVCNNGYEGDGLQCTLGDVSCKVVNTCSENGECRFEFMAFDYVCRCKEGYAGDGYSCLPLDECNSVDDCDYNAQCLYDDVSTRYVCQCNTGYVGDGKSCKIDPSSGCNVLKDCHSDASCVFDILNNIHVCQCNAGFQGDGLDCTRTQTSCNVVNNCDLNADCIYELSQKGYRCQCRQGYRGNGFSCISARTCASNPQMCHRYADCILRDDINQYVCQCREGYRGDGSICRVVAQNEGNFLLFNQGMSVVKMPLDPTVDDKGKIIVMEPYQTAVGIDVDCVDGYIYWTDVAQAKIKRATYNGSNVEVFVGQDLMSPEGIAIDWISRNMYWTDSMKDTVEVMSLDNKYRKVLFNTELKNPRGIAVHPAREKLYWADWHRNNPRIETANLDGTGRKVLISSGLQLPNSLAIDYDREELCWADAGNQKIECLGMLDGRQRTIASPVEYPFGLSTLNDIFYWTDWKAKYIHKMNRGETESELITPPLGGNGRLYAIKAVPLKCPRGSNSCAIQNGGCKWMCLPNGQGSRTCTCPDNVGNATSADLAACNQIN